ncbi:HalOD1 output domain-containing protein [Haladaptatus sp. DYF46]|uniref:HalOD1 output domain-containing protein n=1 Tax=Haladaptatus sp. DYF46 TaxID=2886041 RepID=UPI001E314B89|nr:HalOD1 output domain-containing protein [Haladaptatus sp. DYF46]
MGSEDSPIDQEEKTEEPEQIQAFYNWGDTAPSAAVIDTVAFAAHRELSDLPLLYEVVEPEALDKLITSSNAMRASQDSQLSISFAYANCAVTIKCDGEVCIRSPTHSEKQSG